MLLCHNTMKQFSLTFSEASALKDHLMHYFQQFKSCILLDSSAFYQKKNISEKAYHHSYEWIIAAGNTVFHEGKCLEQLEHLLDKNKKWKFVGIAYDIKNEIEKLHSKNENTTQFPNYFLLDPDIVITYNSREEKVAVYPYNFQESIFDLPFIPEIQIKSQEIRITPRISELSYMEKIQSIKTHLQRGDIYEINFCKEYKAEEAEIVPYETFKKLNRISPMPFSAFFKLEDKYVLSASPERFLKKVGNRLISQPMKGTIKRTHHAAEDVLLAEKLRHSIKDQTENVMIVDLVRNDLSRIATRGSVQVDELFEVYEFPNIYQMISTISCEIPTPTSFVEILKATFPMGSMTGAPKIRAMELSEQYEEFTRGWYAGMIGYITPENDFDFSVLIRSIFYNQTLKTLNFAVGGAITNASEAAQEYEECLLKALPIFKLFEKK